MVNLVVAVQPIVFGARLQVPYVVMQIGLAGPMPSANCLLVLAAAAGEVGLVRSLMARLVIGRLLLKWTIWLSTVVLVAVMKLSLLSNMVSVI